MRSRLNSLSNLQQRVITGVIGVTIIVSSVLYSDWTFALLFCAMSMFTQLEFYKLLGLDGNLPLTFYGTLCGVLLVILTYVVEKGLIGFENYFLISPLLAMIFFIKLYKKKRPETFY